ncbi:hypothetical protein GIB67_013576 [Kingdonia uniflora]|uniref:Uncharacterized protein n=1 Tax=Kingdonia uniflora TaxID=39325 RepID=A0A7J7KUY6_9MAGN|nr:hypothetical protein GIB67_013576 [Kingdonia uniflora]
MSSNVKVESAIGRALRGSAVYGNEALAIVSFMLFYQALQYNVKVTSNEGVDWNQVKLERNLMYLATITDSQPLPPTMHAQFPNAVAQQSAYMQQHQHQHQQAQQMMPQSLMAALASMFYTQPLSAMQQQQAMHDQIGMSSSGNNELRMMHNKGNVGYRVTVATKQDMGSGDSGDGRGGVGILVMAEFLKFRQVRWVLIICGIPNFAEVYSFIESVFDPNSIARLV